MRVTLRIEEYSWSRKHIYLGVCPVCGYESVRKEKREYHIEGHDPEDFGLSPLGETDEEAQRPLWGGRVWRCW
ncbi:hypothetical protein [Halobacterium salinarum]|uniref:hypothetical protein n=1 Tax=Halobacterium salinarum TaxID=2242 RepID=UPI000677BFE2|nr:hypothetical protein [Halobacterium salinarum]MDL0128953.1 hypothetical protein [Halobacterium salinarum]MDL0133766.1 hypothetical protein [Halobacterium salinarum]